ncbi:MAG: phosphotransferase [Acidobacteriota bacterium]|nr:phosphotransferase [Acidobacteriota bacterium]
MWRNSYQPLTLIQETTRSAVYRGMDHDTPVCLKVFPARAHETAGREIAVYQSLRRHPVAGTPTLLHSFPVEETGEEVLVTTWLPGQSLGRFLSFQHRAVPCESAPRCPLAHHWYCALQGIRAEGALAVLCQIADILDQLHGLTDDEGQPLYHGDLAPANILWDGTRAYLIDFGSDGANHRFFHPPEAAPSPAADVFQLWRLVAYLMPDLAEHYPEFLSADPARRPGAARLARVLRDRIPRRRFTRRHILAWSAAALVTAGIGAGAAYRDYDRMSVNELRGLLQINEGRRASIIQALSRKTNSTRPIHLHRSFVWLDASTPRTFAVFADHVVEVGDWVACFINGELVRGVFLGADLVAALIQAPGRAPVEFPWPEPHLRWVHRAIQARACEARPCTGGNLRTIVSACAPIYGIHPVALERLAGASVLGRFHHFYEILDHTTRLGFQRRGNRLLAAPRKDLRILDKWDRKLWYDVPLRDALQIIALDTGLPIQRPDMENLDRKVVLGSIDLAEWFQAHQFTYTFHDGVIRLGESPDV